MKKEKKENNHGLDLCYLYFIRRIKSIKSKDELLLLLYFHNKTTILPIRYFGILYARYMSRKAWVPVY